MLFLPNGMQPMRMQCSYISDDEIHAVADYIKSSREAIYDPDVIERIEYGDRSDIEMELFETEYDPKLPEAVDIALDLGQVSISMLQRKMRIGYARAGRLLDEMSRRGIISEANGVAPRSWTNGCCALTVQQTFDLLEIIEARTKHGATVFCTQYDTDGWYERINADPNQDSHIADAIMDRIVHNAQRQCDGTTQA